MCSNYNNHFKLNSEHNLGGGGGGNLYDHLMTTIGFVKSAIQYVKVHMNKLLQTYKIQWKYDHIITVLVINK